MVRKLWWTLTVSTVFSMAGCDGVRAVLVENYPNAWDDEVGTAQAAPPPAGALQGTFDGLDAGRDQLPVALAPVITGLAQPTDLQFPPGHPGVAVVAEKEGKVRVFSLADGATGALGDLLHLDPPTESEQGVLGLAFHPTFGASGGRLYVHHSVATPDGNVGRVSLSTVTVTDGTWSAGPLSTVLQLSQPYANHNGGQLQFGPDGHLYIGFGDGGWRDDPHGHGQNATTWLGSMLRIDVDATPEDGRAYAIPKDNPFLGKAGVPPETWAIGLRNPWRFSFAPDGRLVVADVGQNKWEEVAIVAAGDNHGWKVREGDQCFEPKRNCPTDGLVDPVYVYGHEQDGQSITGGYVYTGTALPELKGKYVFGDFVSGRIWALDLPAAVPGKAKVSALGRFKAMLVTFGRDAAGEVYAVDFAGGTVFRLVSAKR